MTREQAISVLECMAVDLTGCMGGLSKKDPLEDVCRQRLEAINTAQSSLRPVSREQVEKAWRGEWIIGEPDVLGVPIHCSRCGWGSDHADQRKWMEYNGHLFCGHCGTPMTGEAVEMVMERLEALNDGKGD